MSTRGDEDVSTRWAWLKKEFSKAWSAVGGAEQAIRPARRRERRRGVYPEHWAGGGEGPPPRLDRLDGQVGE